MEPAPFNLSALQTTGCLKLDESHRFLVSGSAKKPKHWTLVPSQSSHSSITQLLQHATIGAVKVSYTGTWVQLETGGTVCWTVNVLRFSGTPKLRTTIGANSVTISLTGATFPGLALSADFTATLSLRSGTEWLSLQFAFCGFSTQVRLVDWLTGTADAEAQVFLDDQVCRIAEGVRIAVAGCASAKFRPSWLFVFSNNKAPFVTFAAAGRSMPANTLALSLLGPGMPSIIPDHADRRSAIVIPVNTAFDFAPWPERTEGWRFACPPLAPPFRRIALEADERVSDHRIRRALMVAGDSGDTLLFRPSPDLLDNTMAPLAIRLSNPVYAAIHLGDGTRLGAAVVAQRTQTSLAAHAPGCSLVLKTPPRESSFLLLESNTTGDFFLGACTTALAKAPPGLPFDLVSTAPHLGPDFVVKPLPPPVASRMILAIPPLARELESNEGEIAVADGDPHVRIRLPEWSWMQVFRPKDLLVLSFQFLGLRAEFHGPTPGRLLRSALQDAPRVLVYLPPQNIAEMAAYEDESTKDETFPDPNLIKVPIPAPHRAAGLSRLAFDVPDAISEIPFTAEALLDWGGAALRPRLDKRALSPARLIPGTLDHNWHVLRPGRVAVPLVQGQFVPIDSDAVLTPVGGAPALDTTAIEAPYRLLISPDQYGYWDAKMPSAKQDDRRTDLWHAPLRTRTAPELPLIRALFAADDGSQGGTAPLEKHPYLTDSNQPDNPPTSLSRSDRQSIVGNSALKAVDANRLMLSALGAWLDLDGDWSEFPERSVARWQHRATLGRDQYVKVVKRGYGYPFGHRLIEITITQRKFGQRPAGRVGAWLRKRRFYVVVQPELPYFGSDNATPLHTAQSREMPFRKVRILTKATPLIDPGSPIIPPNSACAGLTGRWLQVLGKDFLFNFEAEDREGRTVRFSAPMAFIPLCDDVPAPVLALTQCTIDDQTTTTSQSRRRYEFHGQSIAFTEGTDGHSAADTNDIDFSATPNAGWTNDSPDAPFFPKIVSARVTHPALRQFGGVSTPQTIRYAAPYLTCGYSADNQAGQVFAKVDSGSAIAYGDDNPADKVGGLVTPGLTIGGLSRTHGIVGAADSTGAALAGFARGSFNPLEYFGDLSAKLLGGISLSNILDTIDFGNGDTTTPRLTTAREGAVLVNRLSWKTSRLISSSFFRADAGAELVLDNAVGIDTANGAPPASVFSATLRNFSLNLAGLIVIPFSNFSMIAEAGRKPEVDVAIGTPQFDGALSFLAMIESNLQVDKFADPPSVDVSAAGLSIGYSLQLPAIQVGAFALQNLALSAAATLPFNGDPFRVRFALSERQNPFLISVSLFTGGGFFALSFGLDGVECLEVSLEFGGSFSLDIGVASGGVYVMAGIYFKHENDAASLTGYVRAGGSLEVLGLISISVEFYLALAYDGATGNAWGEASMTVEIEVLFFSTEVTLTVRREFAGSPADPTLADTMDAPTWDNNYIAAFAA